MLIAQKAYLAQCLNLPWWNGINGRLNAKAPVAAPVAYGLAILLVDEWNVSVTFAHNEFFDEWKARLKLT